MARRAIRSPGTPARRARGIGHHRRSPIRARLPGGRALICVPQIRESECGDRTRDADPPALASHHPHRPRIPPQHRIARDQQHPLHLRLRDQQRVAVDRGQGARRHRMGTGNGQLLIAVVDLPSAQQPRLGPEILPAERRLDGDLPKARHAEDRRVAFCPNHRPRPRRYPLRRAGGPKQQMRVEQQPQGAAPNSPAISSAPIRSKSFGTAIPPPGTPAAAAPRPPARPAP